MKLFLKATPRKTDPIIDFFKKDSRFSVELFKDSDVYQFYVMSGIATRLLYGIGILEFKDAINANFLAGELEDLIISLVKEVNEKNYSSLSALADAFAYYSEIIHGPKRWKDEEL